MCLLNLFGLFYLASIPALIYIYYFSKKRKRVEISSIIPWKRLRDSVVRSSLFQADLLFYLQLGLFALLTLAACRPYWRGASAGPGGRNVVIIMDRSASMQAMEGRKSRFDLARDRAVKVVRGMGDADRATIITAGALTETPASAERDRSRLEEILAAMRPADTPDRMSPAIQDGVSMLEGSGGRAGAGKAEGKAEQTDVYIFTDRSADSLGLGVLNPAGPIHLERVGSPKGNAALTSISVYHDLFAPGRQASAYVTAENLSPRPFTGTLNGSIKGRRIASRGISLPPGGSLTVKVGEGLPEGLLEVALEPPDALPVDNKGYALLSGDKITRIALFTRDKRLASQLAGLAKAIPHMRLDLKNPAAYDPADMSSYQVSIFHACEPKIEPPTNMLLIFPSPGSRIVDVKGDVSSEVGFLDWDESHPVGENLRGLQNVPLSGSRIIGVPLWARPVAVSATSGGDIPLVLCGNYNGRKTAVMSFDISPLNLTASDSLPLLLLMLNLLKWLSADENNQLSTGDVYTALIPDTSAGKDRDPGKGKSGATYTVINPRGMEENLNPTPGAPLVFSATDYAGEYLVSGGFTQKVFAANLSSRRESDLMVEQPAVENIAPEVAAAEASSSHSPPDRGRLFMLLAAILLPAEWLVFCLFKKKSVPGEGE